MPSATILHLESLAANAWPAAEIVSLDGWRLRFAGGVTRRANSVWPNRHGGTLALAGKLDAAERFYSSYGAPVTFQICDAAQPAGLDGVLADRGYAAISHSRVQRADLAGLLNLLPSLRHTPDFAIEIAEEFDERWFDLFCTSEHVDGHGAAMRRGILERLRPPCGFALLHCAGVPAAVGLGVVEDGWLGVFCMATLPPFRRLGAACAVMRTLALWSLAYGARHAYLQVMENNGPALGLYGAIGFATAYRYHYREKVL